MQRHSLAEELCVIAEELEVSSRIRLGIKLHLAFLQYLRRRQSANGCMLTGPGTIETRRCIARVISEGHGTSARYRESME